MNCSVQGFVLRDNCLCYPLTLTEEQVTTWGVTKGGKLTKYTLFCKGFFVCILQSPSVALFAVKISQEATSEFRHADGDQISS